MWIPGKEKIASIGATLGLLALLIPMPIPVPTPMLRMTSGTAAKNSWRGITPLHSTAEDVARLIGAEHDSSEAMLSGPFKVDGGEVTFSYVTTSLAKIYRAPRSMVGKVFTVYFKPSYPVARADVTWLQPSSGASKTATGRFTISSTKRASLTAFYATATGWRQLSTSLLARKCEASR